ncbi:MAG: hypothetical protein ABR592_00865 [Nitriliruptorales bacterium]
MAAARERFPSRRIADGHGVLWLVELRIETSALHLTHQVNLDVLGLDDRINTGRLDRPVPGIGDPLLDVCQALSDAVFDWWHESPPPLVYRTRSVPSARSVAFTKHVPWTVLRIGRLRQVTNLLVKLVEQHGFDVPQHWLQ